MSVNTINHFDIQNLKLVSYASNREIDITKIWDEVEIFEDLYTNCLSGSITITDSLNLIYHFSICGREKLVITLKTPYFDSVYGDTAVTRTFRVYKISDREPRANDKSLRYTLHFVSEEFVKSQQTKISKAYEGRTDEIIRSIYEDYLKVEYGDGLSNKLLDASRTLHRQKFIIPYWSPLSAINWLAARSVDSANRDNCNFIFYEDLEGFKFKSFAELAKQQPIGEYEYFASTRPTKDGEIATRDLAKEYRTVKEFLMMEYHNTMKNIESGFYSSRMMYHDIVRKQWGCVDYIYGNEFANADHIERNPLVAAGNDDLSVNPLSNFKFYPKHRWLYGFESSYEDNDRYQDWVLRRNAQMQQIEGAKLQFTLPGNSQIRVGQVMKIVVPSFEEKQNPYTDWLDKYMSGKYIISAIRHHMDLVKGYTMRLELTRDSLPTALPDTKIIDASDFPEQGDFFSQVVKV